MRPDQIIGRIALSAAITSGSGSPEAKPVGEPSGAEEFASLASARAYLDAIRAGICSVTEAELAATLARIGTAYRQFPELALECPLHGLLEQLQSTADNIEAHTASIIAYLSASESTEGLAPQLFALIEEPDGWERFLSGLRLVLGAREIGWSPIEKLLERLQREARSDKLLQLLSAVLGRIQFPDGYSRLALEHILRSVFEFPQSPHNEPGSLVEVAVAARRRLNRAVSGRSAKGVPAALVDTADRLRIILSSAQLDARPLVAWPSDRLSFDEFFLQWPCTIDLPMELDDSEFIDEAYRAILLRAPEPDEIGQHLKLMKEGASRVWIVEDLLACEELHGLDRQLRVTLGNRVITEPGRRVDENSPTVTWPMRIVL